MRIPFSVLVVALAWIAGVHLDVDGSGFLLPRAEMLSGVVVMKVADPEPELLVEGETLPGIRDVEDGQKLTGEVSGRDFRSATRVVGGSRGRARQEDEPCHQKHMRNTK